VFLADRKGDFKHFRRKKGGKRRKKRPGTPDPKEQAENGGRKMEPLINANLR